ncbi:MAG: hypothetical protein FWD55_08850 [Propionibacteriaceae bacterium]|nr:hypothetical protein [Propionibacteriaceae bacterium]
MGVSVGRIYLVGFAGLGSSRRVSLGLTCQCSSVEFVDASGPIFAVLVVACLFYFVPRQLNWRIPSQEEIETQSPLHLSVKTVHSGIPVPSEEPPAEVSTFLMRRAGRRAALRLARKAEKRRKAVFAALVFVCLATVPFAIVGWMIHWWVPLAGLGVIIAWALFSRFEALRTQKQLDAIVADTELGDGEETIAVHLTPKQQAPVDDPRAIIGPNGDVQMSLWEPITVVPASYISAPTAARTIRTIDLAPPLQKLPGTEDFQDDLPEAIAV